MSAPRTGETWVYRGAGYPAGAVTVIAVEGDRVEFSPQGGGFVYSQQCAVFVNLHERRADAAPEPAWRAGVFEIEGAAGTFAGWTRGYRWNGWATPSFDRATVHAICAAVDVTASEERREGGEPTITIYPDGGDPMELQPAAVECGGAVRELYEFDGWCWDECDAEGGGDDL